MTERNPHWHDALRHAVLQDDTQRAEYLAFSLQLELAAQMKKLREASHLTQADVAQKLNTSKSVVARLEAAGGKGKHSPSLRTLTAYAVAIGYNLEIKLSRLSAIT